MGRSYRRRARDQKLNLTETWTMRGLLLVEMIFPKSPARFGTIWPVLVLINPPDWFTALRLLIGFAKLTLLKRLKTSTRSATFLESAIEKRLLIDASTLNCCGPRRMFRPTFPKSVPSPFAVAPCELGINCPVNTCGRANAYGLK